MPKVTKTCVICGTEFDVWGKRSETAVTCSRPCSDKKRAKDYEAARVEIECAVCKKKFKVPQCHKDRRNCCSRKCSGIFDGMREHPKGSMHKNWKGGMTVHSAGYLYVHIAEHPFSGNAGYIFEHRVVMEQWMREEVPHHEFLVEVNGIKYLSPEIDVHHMDEIKGNNVRENLVACTPAAHRMIHNGEPPMIGHTWPPFQKVQEAAALNVACTCIVCGKGFTKKRSEVARGAGKFCSRPCYNLGR